MKFHFLVKKKVSLSTFKNLEHFISQKNMDVVETPFNIIKYERNIPIWLHGVNKKLTF